MLLRYSRIMNPKDVISVDAFMAYEKVRRSGVTNMWDVSMVEYLSGLGSETILFIMQHYGQLADSYLPTSEDAKAKRQNKTH